VRWRDSDSDSDRDSDRDRDRDRDRETESREQRAESRDRDRGRDRNRYRGATHAKKVRTVLYLKAQTGKRYNYLVVKELFTPFRGIESMREVRESVREKSESVREREKGDRDGDATYAKKVITWGGEGSVECTLQPSYGPRCGSVQSDASNVII
jgi:hypothetical protein